VWLGADCLHRLRWHCVTFQIMRIQVECCRDERFVKVRAQ